MLRFVADSEGEEFIVGTEESMIAPLQERNPGKTFHSTGSVCSSMRLTTLRSVWGALDRMAHVVTVPEDVRGRAEGAIRRMLAL
jgi:quinolinate synthase